MPSARPRPCNRPRPRGRWGLALALVIAAIVAVPTAARANPFLRNLQGRGRTWSAVRLASEEKHLAVLARGDVVRSAPFSANGNRQPLFRVTLRHPKSGVEAEALFKPRPFGDGEGWNRTPVEASAYRLGRLLDTDYIPPVAYRRSVDVHFQRWDEGAMVLWASDARPLAESIAARPGTALQLLLSDARALDVLIQNSDRHLGNVLFGRHWFTRSHAPLLIDHGAGFRPGAFVTMTHENAFQTGAVTTFRGTTVSALRRLERKSLTEAMGEFHSPAELEAVLDRRDGILRYVRGLRREGSLKHVVFPDAAPH